MKATIELDDELYRQLKTTAVLRGSKIKELVAEGVRMVLRRPENSPLPQRIQLPLVKSKKPGTLRLTGDQISDFETALDAGREV